MATNLSLILVLVLIIMAIGLAFSIGANDETLSALVGAGVLKFKLSLFIGGIAIGIGMILFSGGFVAKTVGSDILGEGIQYTDYMLLTVLISSIIWLVLGSFAGIPLSSTHSLIGSIFGVLIIYAISQGGVNPETALNWDKLGNVVLSWFLSPLFGLLITFILFKIIAKFYLSRLKGLNQIEKSERNFKWLLLVAVIFAEIWVGANSGEALGILYGLLDNGSLNLSQYILYSVICGIFAFLGIYFAARYVIKNLASQMTDSRPSEGLIIQMSSGIILMIATLFGLPISHSHVIVFCIIGMGIAQKKEIDFKGLGKMGIFWVLTFPIAAIMAGFLYLGFLSFGFL
ncbi:MAG: inorganic phosphate transporter [Candidatus Lokiarchaeota archaeon]|nr:inorganic phosphate transporter [Candidatus Lokiarchaeota archaeon]